MVSVQYEVVPAETLQVGDTILCGDHVRTVIFVKRPVPAGAYAKSYTPRYMTYDVAVGRGRQTRERYVESATAPVLLVCRARR